MAASPQIQLINIEDAIILRMLRDQRFLDAFAFLKPAAQALLQNPGGCGSCNRKGRAVTRQQYDDIKRAIAGMSDDGLLQLKQLLNAKQGRVVYPGQNGAIRRTF